MHKNSLECRYKVFDKDPHTLVSSASPPTSVEMKHTPLGVMVVPHEKSGDHQSDYDSHCGEHDCRPQTYLVMTHYHHALVVPMIYVNI